MPALFVAATAALVGVVSVSEMIGAARMNLTYGSCRQVFGL